MRELCRLVERVVGRRDHSHRVRPGLRRVGGKRDGVGRRLGAAMRGDEEPLPCSADEELEPAAALVAAQEDSLSVRAEGEQPVETSRDQVIDDRTERVLVECVPAVAERRDRRSDSPPQHVTTLSRPFPLQ